MQPIDTALLAQVLKRYEGSRAYLHVEFCRGGFVRNVAAQVVQAQIRGDGPYRVALRCQEDGWVIMEELTHAQIPDGAGPLFLCAFEEDQRLSRALQIGLEPFSP